MALRKRSRACYGKKTDAWREQELEPLVTKFLLQPITPQTTLQFEQALQEAARELGRRVLEWTLNVIEPEVLNAEGRYAEAFAALRSAHENAEHLQMTRFNDGVRDYPAGTFIHNPAGSSHVPQSRTGCVLFVFYPEG